jgi:hypothetical protein
MGNLSESTFLASVNMLELKDIKRLHDKAYQAHQVTRERAADDLVFYWVTQWDETILQESQLSYRGEFDIIRKAGRSILADLASNPIQVDYVPKNTTRDDAAEVLDGLYRADNKSNASIESFTNADQECVVCGFGAWLLYTDYVTSRGGDTNQVVKRRPLYEANNAVYFDPQAKLLDKSDARYVVVLTPYSADGYKQLVKDLTGEERECIDKSSFKQPEQSYSFPWLGGEGEKIYVGALYYREKVKENLITLENPFSQTMTVRESDLEELMDDLLDAGYEVISEKTIERWQVTQYICSGAEILATEVIAGEHLPVIPSYGERAYVEGEEHYEGITRLAKDPQRLRNFQLSFLADIASRSPREKPIFTQEQVAGHEDMYSETGAENNYPYLLQNRLAPDGSVLPIGPIAMLPAPNIPPALAATIQLSRQAVEDVANPGLPQTMADPDTSGRAVYAMQAKLEMQSMVYQEHKKHAIRRDGEVYASMAADVYDVPREVAVERPDGTRKMTKTMEMVIDKETGDLVVINDLNNAEFEVYSKISASYTSQKEQTLDRFDKMIQGLQAGDPLRNIMILKSLKLMDGIDFDDIRDYANKQLVILGIRKPETPEEEKALAEAQQNQQPGADMVLAQAEMLKGQAAVKEADIKAAVAQANAQTATAKVQVMGFDAETKRINTQIDAQEAKASIDYKRIDAFGKQLENQAKLAQLQKPENMSDEELYQLATG